MQRYTNESPVFSDHIQIIEEGKDTNHADTVNIATKQLLDNSLVLNKNVEILKDNLLNQSIKQESAHEKLDTHTDNSTVHITASERKTWNTVTDKHTIKRYKIFPTSIKKDSSVVSSLSIPAGGNSGHITVISSNLSNLKGTIWVDMGWTTADDYALVVTYHCVSTSPSGISMVIWNVGQNNYTLTTGTSFNIIGWE